MSDLTDASRKFADQLDPGVHHLSNKALREIYGVARLKRITAKARAGFAAHLQRAGLEVLSDPAQEPLIVRKTVANETGAARSRRRVAKRPWAVAACAVVLLLVLIAVVGDSSQSTTAADDAQAAGTTTAQPMTTNPPSVEPPPAETTPVEPVVTFADAQEAVKDDDFSEAVAIAAVLSADHRSRIRRSISRKLARQVRVALRNGDRGAAKRALRRADRFGPTSEIRAARTSYRAAVARAADRAAARAAAREVARQQAAERRAARGAAQAAAAAEAMAPSYDETPSVPEVDASGPLTTNWCGKRDGDGDGIYCE